MLHSFGSVNRAPYAEWCKGLGTEIYRKDEQLGKCHVGNLSKLSLEMLGLQKTKRRKNILR